uniref:Fucosyltransferase n=1 Tax=Branchiostoma floridae TaxID=7739 RepID=C3YQJ2_BRAFL|eukprot:XP_002601336.1 hypothetical protein BRAFLDRAFT_82754 [Branchiostoma floridae]
MQHSVWLSTECPNYPSINFETYRGVFNWTITYRADSDSLGGWGSLYETYQRLKDEGVDPMKDYTEGKKKLAVWFISKCNTQANRIAYATELVKHMHVDVYGGCGKNDVCAKWKIKCMPKVIRQYKFYLAFENMKCKEYITEKFWRNALENDVVPVVLGANRSDYERLAPPHSFIHVDDFTSPKELANYLKMLDQDKDKYNAYFKWKTTPPKNMPLDEGSTFNGYDEDNMASKEKVDTSFSAVASKVQGTQAKWYHGMMSREDAEVKLKQAGVGSFLIRQSQRPGKGFILSAKVPPKAKAQNVFKKWHVCFHGTDSTAVDSILGCGDLLMPGDYAVGGRKLSEKEGHFTDERKPEGFDTKQIFLSPSIKYSGCDVYAKPKTFATSAGKVYDARVAFQVCVRPESYKIGPETIGATRKNIKIDPHVDNDKIECFTKERGSTILYGLLVNMEETNT